ncbi:MAG TPA: CBS domain-containing protein [Candidatus Dormibacteraeota bacterium]|nr:CBS domain-containing protein [Candidatus Dormibacteraeota bacterium]
MRIGELTRQKVQTADLADTLSQAASQMRFADVSALPVVEAGRVVGILTERDLARAAAEGADPRTHTVAAFMSLGPFVADPAEDSDDVVARMLDLGVRHLPILDGDELVGIVSMRDLLLLEALRSPRQLAHAQTRKL